jgi:hypothetical protein
MATHSNSDADDGGATPPLAPVDDDRRPPPVMRGCTSLGVDVAPMLTHLSTNTWRTLLADTQSISALLTR